MMMMRTMTVKMNNDKNHMMIIMKIMMFMMVMMNMFIMMIMTPPLHDCNGDGNGAGEKHEKVITPAGSCFSRT